MSVVDEFNEFDSNEIFCQLGEASELGCGTYGVVLKGYTRRVGEVAVKCIEVDGGPQAKALLIQEVEDEIKALIKANHMSIVRVYGWTKWYHSFGIVMEYLPGGNLKSLLLNQQIPLSFLLRRRMCEEIADGIAFIHNLAWRIRLIHGDLKPENILLTIDYHCKIGDFGSSKLSRYTSSSLKSNSMLRHAKFTKVYAAPERLEESSHLLTKEMDAYSFGLMVYTIITRLLPYDNDPELFLENVKAGRRPNCAVIVTLRGSGSPSDVRIIDLLEELMRGCWHQLPKRRLDMCVVRDRLKQHPTEQEKRDVQASVKPVTDAMAAALRVSSTPSDDWVRLTRYSTHRRSFPDYIFNLPRPRSGSGHSFSQGTANLTGNDYCHDPRRLSDVTVANPALPSPNEVRLKSPCGEIGAQLQGHPSAIGGIGSSQNEVRAQNQGETYVKMLYEPELVPLQGGDEAESRPREGLTDSEPTERCDTSDDDEYLSANEVLDDTPEISPKKVFLNEDKAASVVPTSSATAPPSQTQLRELEQENQHSEHVERRQEVQQSQQENEYTEPDYTFDEASHGVDVSFSHRGMNSTGDLVLADQPAIEQNVEAVSVPKPVPKPRLSTMTKPSPPLEEIPCPPWKKQTKPLREEQTKPQESELNELPTTSGLDRQHSASTCVEEVFYEETDICSETDIELFLQTHESSRFLFEKYKIEIRKGNDTHETITNMLALLKQQNMCIPWLIKDIAFRYAEDEKFVQSTLCYNTAIEIYKSKTLTEKLLQSLESCVIGLKVAFDHMVNAGKRNSGAIAGQKVVLLLDDIKTWGSSIALSDGTKFPFLVTCLDCIQHCQSVCQDYAAQVETLSEAIIFQNRLAKVSESSGESSRSYYSITHYREAAKHLEEVFNSFQDEYKSHQGNSADFFQDSVSGQESLEVRATTINENATDVFTEITDVQTVDLSDFGSSDDSDCSHDYEDPYLFVSGYNTSVCSPTESGSATLQSAESRVNRTLEQNVMYWWQENLLERISSEFADMLQKYTSSIKNQKSNESQEIQKQIDKYFEENLKSYNPKLMAQTAESCRQENKFQQSVALYTISTMIYPKEQTPEWTIEHLKMCVEGMREVCEGMMRQDRKKKFTIRDHVIPLMHDALGKVHNQRSVDKQLRCLSEAWCLHYIEHCQGLIGDINARESTLLEAVNVLKGAFGSLVTAHKLYGHCLHNLGSVKMLRTAFSEADDYWRRALNSYQSACDWNNEAERRKDMDMCLTNIGKVRKKLKPKK